MRFMNRRLRRLAVLAIIAVLSASLTGSATISAEPVRQAAAPILLTGPVADPHQAGVQWFAPTGHTLRGSFLHFWTNNGGLAQFGYPLTEEFVEPVGEMGKLPLVVQYFERNRFERHPENTGTQYEVLLGTFGRAVTAGREGEEPFRPAGPVKIRDARYFPETEHNIRLGPFVTYWNTHGGLSIHGYPISEQFEEKNPIDGKIYPVQYFERSRMEYHPENVGTPNEVLLGQLGIEVARKKGYPYGWYPEFGRATDFSWISGRVFDEHSQRSGCLYIVYGQHTETTSTAFQIPGRFMPTGPGVSAARAAGLLGHGTLVVSFGHQSYYGSLATSNYDNEVQTSLVKPYTHACFGYFYWTDKMQANPAR